MRADLSENLHRVYGNIDSWGETKNWRARTWTVCHHFRQMYFTQCTVCTCVWNILSKEEWGYLKLLSTMSPMNGKTSQSSQEHYEYLKCVSSVFNCRFSNVVALTGDYSCTNRALARHVGLVFMGCYLHQFNLAITEYMWEQEFVIENVKKLMGKRSSSI